MRLIKYKISRGSTYKTDGVGSAKIDFNNRVCIFPIATINRNPGTKHKNSIIPVRDDLIWKYINYTRTGFLYIIHLKSYPNGINMFNMSTIGDYIKKERKKAGLTQEDFAIRSGLGLRFVRELEQGKETVRLDKVNQALAMFGKEAVPGKKED